MILAVWALQRKEVFATTTKSSMITLAKATTTTKIAKHYIIFVNSFLILHLFLVYFSQNFPENLIVAKQY